MSGVEITEPLRKTLITMRITEVCIVGRKVPGIPKEEFVAKVNVTFTKTGEDPRMAAMKKEHIEELC